MKLKKSVLPAMALVLASIGAAPVAANTLTFQGVTFETIALDADTLRLTIDNVLSGPSGSDNWLNVSWLGAFEIKEIGTVTGATLDSWSGINLTGWTPTVDNGLAANAVGCNTGGTPGACFSGTPAAMSDHMVITMSFTGSGLTFDAPHLKVAFLESSTAAKPTGDLLSQNIPAIPEPETYALMGLGLGLMGFVARRRRQRAIAA